MNDTIELLSEDVVATRLARLRVLFPEIFVDGRIDYEKLREVLGGEVEVGRERYGMSWAGKNGCYKVIQSPSFATLSPEKEKSLDFDSSQNIFIEGDNLEVLKLLQKSYCDRIKMIYIDPPYNTGNDFVYKDNFSDSLENYLAYTGQKNSDGVVNTTNPETDGRYHSNWMNMMYPRLFLARNLLKDDGVIFISIDDHEVDNLKKQCNEIFGEENFIAQLVWANKEGGGGSDSSTFKIKHEYILVYAKLLSSVKIIGEAVEDDSDYPYSDEYVSTRGKYKLIKLNSFSIQYSKSLDYEITAPDGTRVLPSEHGRRAIWRWSKQKFEWGKQNGFVQFSRRSSGEWVIYTKQYYLVDNNNNAIVRRLPPKALIEEFSSTSATKHITSLFNQTKIFDYSKPYQLIEKLINWVVQDDDIVLDFFAGIATTGEAVYRLNSKDEGSRRFILVQLPELVEEDSEAFRAGYKTISQIASDRLKKAVERIRGDELNKPTDSDYGFRFFSLAHSCFNTWKAKSDDDIYKQLGLYSHSIRPHSSPAAILYELIIKSGYSLSSEITEQQISGKTIYFVNNDQLAICLDTNLDIEFFNNLVRSKLHRAVFLDEGFAGNDSLKMNVAELMKKFSIEFRTV